MKPLSANVVCLQTATGELFLAITTRNRSQSHQCQSKMTEEKSGKYSTQIVRVGARDGVLRQGPSFSSPDQAKEWLSNANNETLNLRELATADGVAGLVVAAGCASILLVKSNQGTVLPGHHVIRTVSSAFWLTIPLLHPDGPADLAAHSTHCFFTNPSGENGVSGSRSTESTGLSGRFSSVGSPLGSNSNDLAEVVAVQRTAVRAATRGCANQTDATSLHLLREFILDNLHFYCETMDLTRPFPSQHDVHDFAPEFCWNAWLAQPFAAAGLRHCCVVLLQGMARGGLASPLGQTPIQAAGSASSFTTSAGSNGISSSSSSSSSSKSGGRDESGGASDRGNRGGLYLTLITRKSNTHAGTRYHARGLNHAGGVGNEIECELLLHSDEMAGAEPGTSHVEWVSHVWRRGTVPIWWKSTMQSTIARETGVEIREDPFHGAELYYASVVDRYESSMAGGLAPVEDTRSRFEIVLCSLLRCDLSTPAETQLAASYQESLRYVEKLFHTADIRLFNFDWHHNLKQLGSDAAISGLWTLVAPFFRGKCGLSHGWVLLSPSDSIVPVEQSIHTCPDGRILTSFVRRRQGGILRYNCADSLDRTNVATFFMSFQVVMEMLRHMHIANAAMSAGLVFAELPTDTSWPNLSNVTDVASAAQNLARAGVLDLLVEFFVQNGDVCSLLYTNSPAMHTQPMRELASTKQLQSAPMNAIIAIRRRYHNLLTDSVRHAQYAMFLGRKLHRHFPHTIHPSHTALGYSVRCLTDGPRAFLLKDIPNVMSGTDSSSSSTPVSAFLDDRDNHIWCVSPDSGEMVNVYIHLDEPATLTEIILTVAHGGVPPGVQTVPGGDRNLFQPMLKDPKNAVFFHTPPAAFDMYAGITLDAMLPVFAGVELPYAANGTQLTFDVSHDPWGGERPLTGADNANVNAELTGTLQMPGSQSASQPATLYDFYADRNLHITSNRTDGSGSGVIQPGVFRPGSSVISIVHLVFHKRSNFTELQEMGMTLGGISVFGNVVRASTVETTDASVLRLDEPLAALDVLEQIDVRDAVDKVLTGIDSSGYEHLGSSGDKRTSTVFTDISTRSPTSTLRSASRLELEQYVDAVLDILRTVAPQTAVEESPLTFVSALALELTRVQLNVSPAQRDDALARIIQAYRDSLVVPAIKAFDPATHIRLRDPDRLATLYEQRDDKLEQDRLRTANPVNVCHASGCSESLQLRWFNKVFGGKTGGTSGTSSSLAPRDARDPETSSEIFLSAKRGGSRCAYCGFRYCSAHMFGAPVNILEFGWVDSVTQRARVCKSCAIRLEECDEVYSAINTAVAERSFQFASSQFGSLDDSGFSGFDVIAALRASASRSAFPWAHVLSQRNVEKNDSSGKSALVASTVVSCRPRGRLLYGVPSRGAPADMVLDGGPVSSNMDSRFDVNGQPWIASPASKSTAQFCVVLLGHSVVDSVLLRFPCSCCANACKVSLLCGSTLNAMTSVTACATDTDTTLAERVFSFEVTEGTMFFVSLEIPVTCGISSEKQQQQAQHDAGCSVSTELGGSLLALLSLRVRGQPLARAVVSPGWHFLNRLLQTVPPVERVAYETSTGRMATMLSARVKRVGEATLSSTAGSRHSPNGGSSGSRERPVSGDPVRRFKLAPLPPHLGGAIISEAGNGGGRTGATTAAAEAEGNVVSRTSNSSSSDRFSATLSASSTGSAGGSSKSGTNSNNSSGGKNNPNSISSNNNSNNSSNNNNNNNNNGGTSAPRSEFESALGDGISSAADGMKVVLLRPQWAHYRQNSGRRVLDVGVDSTAAICGFSMLVRHSERDGKGSQVKIVRVSAVTTDARGLPVAARTLCTRIVPMVRPGTELLFDFARCRGAHVYVFEFLACYGPHYGGSAGDIAPPRVALFVRPQ